MPKGLRKFFVATLAAIACSASTAGPISGMGTWETTLQPRDLTGDGAPDAFYDSVLDITWLRDARPAEGKDWHAAKHWVDDLTVASFDDWRLPTALDVDGHLCYGYRCAGSEMGHLWLVTLGNLDLTVFNGNSPIANTGDFLNLAGYYWTESGQPYWQTYFLTSTGLQDYAQDNLPFFVLAVRDGNVLQVPEPSLALQLVTAAAALIATSRRRRPARLRMG